MRYLLVSVIIILILIFDYLYKNYKLNFPDLNNKKYDNKNKYEQVTVELLDSGKIYELIRTYEYNTYNYYMLDGTYIYDLKNFIVIAHKPMARLFFVNQQFISCEDLDGPAPAMRPEDLSKLKFFKT